MQATVHLKPSAHQVLQVLSDHEPHPVEEFWRGFHGFTVNAVSQRVGELKRAGFAVENVSRDGGVAVYQLKEAAV